MVKVPYKLVWKCPYETQYHVQCMYVSNFSLSVNVSLFEIFENGTAAESVSQVRTQTPNSMSIKTCYLCAATALRLSSWEILWRGESTPETIFVPLIMSSLVWSFDLILPPSSKEMRKYSGPSSFRVK